MADASIEEIHQIEYRWHTTWDLSPAASSMPEELTMRWDAQIRGWVRHPSVEAPSDSVRYQMLPGGAAMLAWRYQNLEVTDAQGGVRGRPLVSRVLVGAQRTLTPEVAMALCRTGLPALAGPRPGEAAPKSELPMITAAHLAALARDAADGLDHEAAWEEDLRPMLAAAFTDPDTPLVVGVGEPQIFQPSAQGVQALLLWGLWRVGRPLLGRRRRGWSFSTFETPVGYVDPRTLPDILFRSAQVTQTAPPTMPRKELRVLLGAGSGSAASTVYEELAAWFVAEYREMGGGELQKCIAELVDGTPPESRLLIAYDRLSAKWAPPPADPAEPEILAAQTLAPAVSGLEASEQQGTVPETSEVGGLPDEQEQEYAKFAPPPFSLAELLDQLATTRDPDLFDSMFGDAIAPPLQPDGADRQRARTVLGDNNCLVPVFRRQRYDPHEYALSRIFCLIVIPDLDQPGVRDEIAAWAYRGERAVVAALLAAARDSGTEAWSLMRETLRPVLAELWLTDRGLMANWSPGPASPPDITPWRGGTALRPGG